MALLQLDPVEKATIWMILGKYAEVRLKLHWGPIRPSIKVRVILEALIGPEDV